LSGLLELDYRTIRHHLDLLKKNGLIISIGEAYGTMYFLSRELEDNYEIFEAIWNKIGTTLKRKDKE
jgi:DNA-binding transcriptional ArsR family regulator